MLLLEDLLPGPVTVASGANRDPDVTLRRRPAGMNAPTARLREHETGPPFVARTSPVRRDVGFRAPDRRHVSPVRRDSIEDCREARRHVEDDLHLLAVAAGQVRRSPVKPGARPGPGPWLKGSRNRNGLGLPPRLEALGRRPVESRPWSRSTARRS